jgi:hypothetical protein
VQECWSKEPGSRPGFGEVLERLKAEMPVGYCRRHNVLLSQ